MKPRIVQEDVGENHANGNQRVKGQPVGQRECGKERGWKGMLAGKVTKHGSRAPLELPQALCGAKQEAVLLSLSLGLEDHIQPYSGESPDCSTL